MQHKIVFIAPYENLKKLADQVIEKNHLSITTIVYNLSDAIQAAQNVVAEGCEVIVSRGGTARLIRENVNVPIVEIKVTGYDLLRILYKYDRQKEPLGIIGYGNVIYGVKAICDVLNINIQYYLIEEESEVEIKVQEAIDRGIRTVIGDTIGVEVAKRYGLKNELIESGEEALLNGFLEGIQVLKATMREREERQKLQVILDSAHEGIIAVDDTGIINAFNPQAQKLFQVERQEVMGHPIMEIIPNTQLIHTLDTKKEDIGSIQNIGETKIATNRVPIIVNGQLRGAVATFQDVTRIQELEQKIRQQIYEKGLTAQYTLDDIIGQSARIQQCKELSRKYGRVDSTVLIRGESGTGKELFAQGIHNSSERKMGPFVAINCAALPTNLLESELFGYEEGTFTGAKRGGKVGLFELAHNGTIFLDEIGEMELSLQARLLRVIQEKQVMRLGGRKVIPVDVRILAATNRDLKYEVKKGNFRQDLFYRLSVLTLEIPPLRERGDDLRLLFDFLLKKKCQEFRETVLQIDEKVLQPLLNYSWPGNVRELENIVEKLVVISESEWVKKEDVQLILSELAESADLEQEGELIALTGTLEEMEREIILKTIELEGSKTGAAAKLGIDRTTLWRKLKLD